MSLNLLAPGVGQFALRRWLRGLLFLGASLTCFVWALVGIFKIMIGNLYNALDGKPVVADLYGVFIPIGLTVLIWIVSYVDLFLFSVPEPTASKSPPIKDTGNGNSAEAGTSDNEKIRAEVARQLEELRKEGKIIVKNDD